MTLPKSRPLFLLTLLVAMFGPLFTMAVPADGLPPLSEVAAAPRPSVIAIMDTGINPYHAAFRGFEGVDHPSAMIPGYPTDAQPLPLTLDAPSLNAALMQDTALWESLRPGTLYYVPGTKIIGAIAISDDEVFSFLDTNGHGTNVADAAAGNEMGAAPDAAIVIVVTDDIPAAVQWVIDQQWIDFLSLSFGWFVLPAGGATLPAPEPLSSYEAKIYTSLSKGHDLVDGGRILFQGAGNGPSSYGVGVNALSADVPPWVFATGGYRLRSGHEVIYELGDRPFDAAARMEGFWADHESLDGTVYSQGTSFSAPTTAGYAARLLADARRLLADDQGFRDGQLAIAPAGRSLPESGPLADGSLSARELESAMMSTARPVPVRTWWTGPDDAPAEARFWYHGYGVLDERTLEQAWLVILGELETPVRPWDDYWHARYGDVMGYYWSQWECIERSHWTGWSGCPYDPIEAASLFEEPAQWVPPAQGARDPGRT